MANENNIVKAKGIYNGSTVKKDFQVELKFLFIDDQLPKALGFVAAIGKNIKLKAQVVDDKLDLGSFNIKKIQIDKNGNTLVVFTSIIDYVNIEQINGLLIENEEISLVGKITEQGAEG